MKVTGAGKTKNVAGLVGMTVWAAKRVIGTAFFGRNDVPGGIFDGRLSAAARMTIQTEADGVELDDGVTLTAEHDPITFVVAEQPGT